VANRLDPAYNNRGISWLDKKEYDKDIGDFNEAIRLDPGYASAYNGRGYAWLDKKEYDKAIADFNEAVRLDPGNASA
jgi:tetratricopeptide (TPR) repeat protein